MSSNLIVDLVELAISIAENQFYGEDLNNTLLDIVYKGAEAFESNSGHTLNVSLIQEELPL
jgi:hypothetical protein